VEGERSHRCANHAPQDRAYGGDFDIFLKKINQSPPSGKRKNGQKYGLLSSLLLFVTERSND